VTCPPCPPLPYAPARLRLALPLTKLLYRFNYLFDCVPINGLIGRLVPVLVIILEDMVSSDLPVNSLIHVIRDVVIRQRGQVAVDQVTFTNGQRVDDLVFLLLGPVSSTDRNQG